MTATTTEYSVKINAHHTPVDFTIYAHDNDGFVEPLDTFSDLMDAVRFVKELEAATAVIDAAMNTRKFGYEKGWQASRRTQTFDLDAAEDRYTEKYGHAGHDGFIAGWTDYAAGNEKGTSL